jgi:hypothetical protein
MVQLAEFQMKQQQPEPEGDNPASEVIQTQQ